MAHLHRARIPDFWTPHRQPVRPVEIDWTHPLTARLVGFWLFNGPLPFSGRNLVTNAPLPVNGGTPSVAVDAGGVAVRTSGTAGGTSAESYGESGQAAFTFAAGIARPTDSTSSTGISALRSGTARRHWLTLSAAHLPIYTTFYGVSVATMTGITPLEMGRPYTLIGTTRASNDHELFVDGASEGTSAVATGTNPGQRNNLLLGQIGSNDGRDLLHYWVAAWARGFSAEDAASLASGPYKLLKPAG